MTDKKFPLMREKLKDIRVAAIMDQFTEHCYAPECILCQLTPGKWLQEITDFNPDILIVESAWRGKDDLWKGMAHMPSEIILGIIDYCKTHKIPTVFWNKEDPVNYDHFRSLVGYFDYIFTTDKDTVPVYKKEFNKQDVYFLHFAAQPKIHNPIEKFDRKDRFCFAGSYYHKYPQRQKDFKVLMDVVLDQSGVDIFDRNYQLDRPDFIFPDEYLPYIKGSLPPEEIDVAYKGYFYNINVNTIKDSETMFARRVFEVMASNTVLISNYSRGLETLFGDYLIYSDDSSAIKEKLSPLIHNQVIYKKYRLAGLRNILSQHLYEDRLAYIVDKVFQQDFYYRPPLITVYSSITSKETFDKVYQSYCRQLYGKKRLLVFSSAPEVDLTEVGDVTVYRAEEQDKVLGSLDPDDCVACFSSNDYYGKNYLTDLASACRYADAGIICKSEHYAVDGKGGTVVANQGDAYRYVKEADVAASLFRARHYGLASEGVFRNVSAFSVDPFNYCKGFSGEALPLVDDLDKDYHFADLAEIYSQVETGRIELKPVGEEECLVDENLLLDADFNFIATQKRDDGYIKLLVSEPEKKHEVVYSDLIAIDPDKEYRFFLSGYCGMKYRFGCCFHDKDNKIVSWKRFTINTPPNLVDIPDDVYGFRIYARFEGEGAGLVYQLRLTSRQKQQALENNG